MTMECEMIRTVETENLAVNVKSGSLEVLATPAMIAWMEEASCLCLDLEEGFSSVGIEINAHHYAPSPLGAQIRITSKVTEQKGKIISFYTEAWMNQTRIGWAEHKRAVIHIQKFMNRLNG